MTIKRVRLDALKIAMLARATRDVGTFTFQISGDTMVTQAGSFMAGFRVTQKIDNPDEYEGEFAVKIHNDGFMREKPLHDSVEWTLDDVLKEVSYVASSGKIITAKMVKGGLMEPVSGTHYIVDLTDMMDVPLFPSDILTASNGHLYIGNVSTDLRWLLRANEVQAIPDFTVSANLIHMARVAGLGQATTLSLSEWHASLSMGDDYVYVARLLHRTDAPEAILKALLTTPVANAVPIPHTWRDIVAGCTVFELESSEGYLRLRSNEALEAEVETREDAPEWSTYVTGSMLGAALIYAGPGATVALTAAPKTLLVRGAKAALMVPTKEST